MERTLRFTCLSLSLSLSLSSFSFVFFERRYTGSHMGLVSQQYRRFKRERQRTRDEERDRDRDRDRGAFDEEEEVWSILETAFV